MTKINFQSTDGQIPNQVLSHDQILTEMNSVGSELDSLVKLTPDQRQLLLLKFNWDIKSLRKTSNEYTDMNKLLLRNGICPKNMETFIKKSECAICCAEGKVFGLRCQHMACADCWKDYLTNKIKSGHSLLHCMSCHLSISDETLEKFLNDPKLMSSHQKLVIDSYVKADPSLAWCNKKCEKAVRRSTSDTVLCTCGSKFCFSCGSDPHLPATCRQEQLWNKKRMDNESRQKLSNDKSYSWILGNTKDCPYCGAPIEKRGGCNRMVCTRCNYRFCWKCCHNWSIHGGICKLSDITAEQSRLKSRSNFLGFTQYFLRFKHHKQCLTLERQKLPALQFTTILVESRLILMNSCIFEYFLKHGKYSKTFEKHQKNLESAVENLSKHLKESQKGNSSVSAELAKKCEQHQKSLLDHCAKGGIHEDLEGRRIEMPTSVFTIWDSVEVAAFVILFGILLIICCLVILGLYLCLFIKNYI